MTHEGDFKHSKSTTDCFKMEKCHLGCEILITNMKMLWSNL